MKTLRISFKRGGIFTAPLDETRAPTNVKTLWDLLPIRGEVGHGMLSGELLYSKVENLDVKKENPKVMGIPAGCIALESIPTGSIGFPPGILLAYGPKVRFATPFTPDGEPIWMVGQITDNLEELYRIGWRVHEQGVEDILFERHA